MRFEIHRCPQHSRRMHEDNGYHARVHVCDVGSGRNRARADYHSASDVTNALTPGHSLANKIDKVTSTLNVGSIGATSWDFSALGSDSSQTLVSVAVSGTPFAGRFPAATHAFQTDLNVVYLGTAIAATGYLYFQLSTNLLNLGEGATAPGLQGSLLAFNIPADVFYSLPSTYGTTWTSTYLDTTDIYILQTIHASATGVRHNVKYTVDAYGPMKIPGGSVHDALRIKKTDSTASGKSLSFIFLARDFASVQVSVVDPSGPDVGSLQIYPNASWNDQVVALPIQLVSFDASQRSSGDGVLLRWSTLSEVNNYGFEIRRGMEAGGEFQTVPGAFVPGHGTTTVPRNYTYEDVSATAGTWYYRLRQVDLDGTVHDSDPAKVDVQPGRTAADVPAAFSLAQNFPNPFNPVTTIRYGLPSKSYVELAVYNVLGERVALLVRGEQEGGFHESRFDGSALSSGVYFYRLTSAGFVETKKLSLLR
jgi:hypothetical protein